MFHSTIRMTDVIDVKGVSVGRKLRHFLFVTDTRTWKRPELFRYEKVPTCTDLVSKRKLLRRSLH